MKSKLSKSLALVLALVLALSLAIPALADDADDEKTIIGTGTYTNAVDGNVWSIEFPLTDALASFIIDPNHMIGKMAEGGAYEGVNVTAATGDTPATILFNNYNDDNEITKLSGTSDDLKVTNKGSTDVSIGLTASLTTTAMKLRDNAGNFTDDTEPAIWIQVTDKTPTTPVTGSVTAIPAVFESDVAADMDAFETVFHPAVAARPAVPANAEEGIEASEAVAAVPAYFGYQTKDAATEDTYTGWKSATFSITGKANTNTGVIWDSSVQAPDLHLKWNVRNKVVPGYAINISKTDCKAGADVLKVVPGTTATEFYVYVVPTDANKPAITVTAKASLYKTSGSSVVIRDNEALTVAADADKDINGAKAYKITVPKLEGATPAAEDFAKTKAATGNPANTIDITITCAAASSGG